MVHLPNLSLLDDFDLLLSEESFGNLSEVFEDFVYKDLLLM